MDFVKGHGTENDFVVLPDVDDRFDLGPDLVRALCDRRAGLGADGVLRVVRDHDGGWFMDYRNADGSLAEMCGNGVRVFARYLAESGRETRRAFVVGTRAGPRPVELHDDGSVTVQMGPARVGAESAALLGGRSYPGRAVDVGNPHLVCVVDEPLDDLPVVLPPGYDAGVFPHGVNVEFVTVCSPQVLRMRVHERGSGETRSCGTGIVAAAAAVLAADGRGEGTLEVRVPGGTTTATIRPDGATLTGPAVLVAAGTLSDAWLAAVSRAARTARSPT